MQQRPLVRRKLIGLTRSSSLSTNGGVNERACPHCGSPVPSTPGYLDWCERCGWNLEPPPGLHARGGGFAAIAGALGRRSGEHLARRLGGAPELGPRWSAARVLAYLIAVIVLLLNFALL